MDVTTTFDVGQQVWHVWNQTRREVEKCSVCVGAGQVRVVGSDELIGCPKCYRKGELKTGEQYVDHVVSTKPMTVGLVRVTVEGPSYGTDRFGGDVDRSNMGPRSYKRTEEYMLVETGIGSGRIYKQEDLFATREEADAEAGSRTRASIDGITRYEAVEA